MKRLAKIFGALVILLAAVLYAYIGYGLWDWPLLRHNKGTVPLTPPWALECWVWEDDVNTADFVRELLAGYREHDFPVRTILIDSPWSTRYNDFAVDEARYPEPETFFKELKDEGYRVVLWMTTFVNSRSKDTAIQESPEFFQEAADKGYLATGPNIVPWWKGRGGLIDYSNPEAMRWWRGMQQQVFDWGLDGWKLDGTATYFHQWWGPIPSTIGRTHGGWMTTRKYMNHYYRDEYRHGLTQNPEFITMSRSIDHGELRNAHPWGFAPLDAAPVTWVGDNKHTWDHEGIQEALKDILLAADLGYAVIGSDIGGYHGGREIPANLYIRWAQFSTFCGFFLNGGHGERRMWLRSPEELEIIRQYSWLHTELIPYIYSHVVNAHRGTGRLMRPMKRTQYQYLFGDDFLVAPIYEDSTRREVILPAGRWRYYFDDGKYVEGPGTVTWDFPLDEFPVFVRDGAIIPMHIERGYTGIGDRDWKDHLAYDIYPDGASRFEVHPTDHSDSIAVAVNAGQAVDITLDGGRKPHILRVRALKKPDRVLRDGAPLAEGAGWAWQEDRGRVIIRDSTGAGRAYRIE